MTTDLQPLRDYAKLLGGNYCPLRAQLRFLSAREHSVTGRISQIDSGCSQQQYYTQLKSELLFLWTTLFAFRRVSSVTDSEAERAAFSNIMANEHLASKQFTP